MAYTTVFKVTHDKPDTNVYDLSRPGLKERYWFARQARRLFDYFSTGLEHGSIVVTIAGTSAAYASGTVTISSGTGSITATINGVAIAVTWGTSDTATATALAAAINASTNALVKGLVTATSAAGVVTVKAFQPGKLGNAITLAASGTGATASGARLTGGAGDDVAPVTFTY